MADPDDGDRRQRFRTTCWDEIRAARDPDHPEGGDALARLCRTYWYPLYAFARRKGLDPDRAEDLTQGFFAHWLGRDALRGVDPDRGRFRSYLLASFDNYRKNERARERRLKRGGGMAPVSIDAEAAEARYLREPAHVETAERLYDRRWALTLIDEALARLERRMEARGQRPLFDRLRPALLGSEAPEGYAGVARELGMSETAVKVAAHRMRGRLGALIREEIARTVADPAQVDDELRDLFAALHL